MTAYEVEIIHQVTEVYEVEAASREEAWSLVSDPLHHPDPERANAVRMIRTHHGRREVWGIKRRVQDVRLPDGPLKGEVVEPRVVTLGACRHCGTSASACLTGAGDLGSPTELCCAICQHPEGAL